MNVTKTISTVGVGAAIVAGSMMAVNLASAHEKFSEEQQATRVTELAERFNLDESEVQSYFEEKKAEHQEEREAARAEFVAGLVEDGTLTQEQADELAAMKDDIKSEVQALKESGAEREEIKALMEENRAAVEAWAEAEGLDLDAIRPEKGEGQRGGHGHHGPHNEGEAAEDLETSSVNL